MLDLHQRRAATPEALTGEAVFEVTGDRRRSTVTRRDLEPVVTEAGSLTLGRDETAVDHQRMRASGKRERLPPRSQDGAGGRRAGEVVDIEREENQRSPSAAEAERRIAPERVLREQVLAEGCEECEHEQCP